MCSDKTCILMQHTFGNERCPFSWLARGWRSPSFFVFAVDQRQAVSAMICESVAPFPMLLELFLCLFFFCDTSFFWISVSTATSLPSCSSLHFGCVYQQSFSDLALEEKNNMKFYVALSAVFALNIIVSCCDM